MSFLLSTLTEVQELALCGQDFPPKFKDGQHPDDYVEQDLPITPQCIFHVRGRHCRLWWRVSWKLNNGKFMPMSFLLDTGAPKHLYLSKKAIAALERDAQLVEDAELDLEYVTLSGRKCPVDAPPAARQPANVIGLQLLKRLGLVLCEDEPHFSFTSSIPFISMGTAA